MKKGVRYWHRPHFDILLEHPSRGQDHFTIPSLGAFVRTAAIANAFLRKFANKQQKIDKLTNIILFILFNYYYYYNYSIVFTFSKYLTHIL